ncbi:threonine--tRNA ligase [Steroidobacter agaridevorans]|uniref:Threonine--tRNA ligase n=1 Tax=Steroidobacter agaridevorans TaxID=2695856 RepID=A0A829YHE4_9GAMM|nr:threonine--tRNA ligase [Steroidobacter agaridevorans]GFE82629.1 threonine--tRNA ligase [Steroidobacter agaridevorans]GFE85055.1 threonine--tRNA ligase [Steroidobacter agaridevorans]
MPVITLPDGSQRTYAEPVSVEKVAADIGAGLAKAALAGKVDGRLVDTSHVIDKDAQLAIVTSRDAEGVDVIRHSTAHLLAQAVKQLFPEAQVTIGPVIEDGFYYDFAYKRPFTTEDLTAIETRMHELSEADQKVSRRVMSRNDAVKFFQDQGEIYKAEIIASIPEKEDISLYGQGDWVDLCRGPHVPSTGKLKAFKLMKVAGAYWRGDSRNEMLQRIYGTAWGDEKSLKAYLTRLEEAEKRDHRKIGKEQDLFHFQEEAPGAVFWHPKGWTLFQTLIGYMRQYQGRAGWQEVSGPEVMDVKLWDASGHLATFAENMYFTEVEKRKFCLKPMNCPGHVQIFNQGLRSYRDLPLRFCEFGKVHRYEPSGALHGLMRVRAFTQDDGHSFVAMDQLFDEAVNLTKLILGIYADFGFTDVRIKFSDRPPKRVGADEVWDQSEAALKQAVTAAGLEYTLNPGEGAFYGPKLEFVLRDAIGRDWQCGTLQVDLNMPGRLGAHYIGEDGQKHTPVMLHRAMFGSLERFTGILIEHFAGKLPTWLAPVQAVVMNITDGQAEYVRSITEVLKNQGLRVTSDLRNEKVGFKIREHTLQRVPYLLVAGDREAGSNSLAVRTRNGKDLGAMPVETLAAKLAEEVASRGRTSLEV